jgi:Fe-S oxidoreductase
MHIDKYLDVINACRFCFMCRHLATLGNVTFEEADTPRGRALILDRIRMDKANLADPDYIKTIYEAPLSATCRYHCVSHYDETGLLLAARRDIIEAGLEPENVKELAKELKKVDFKVEGTGSTLYYLDMYSESAAMFPECKVISGGDTGKALEVLGFTDEAVKIFAKFKAAVESSGCKTLVTSCPASYDMLKDKLDGIKVIHSSEYLLERELPKTNTVAYYLDSDYLKNYCGNPEAPRELLKKCGYELKSFGTNQEESYAAGEGAVIYDKLNPELTKKLCARIVELTDNPEQDLLITASPYTKYILNKYAPQLKVISLEEAVNGGVK